VDVNGVILNGDTRTVGVADVDNAHVVVTEARLGVAVLARLTPFAACTVARTYVMHLSDVRVHSLLATVGDGLASLLQGLAIVFDDLTSTSRDLGDTLLTTDRVPEENRGKVVACDLTVIPVITTREGTNLHLLVLRLGKNVLLEKENGLRRQKHRTQKTHWEKNIWHVDANPTTKRTQPCSRAAHRNVQNRTAIQRAHLPPGSGSWLSPWLGLEQRETQLPELEFAHR
jgi:hypothetical protein